MTVMSESILPLLPVGHGKVRDIYHVDQKHILLVATDRVSAFDVVMREPIPYKGAVLTQLTAWWLRRLQGTVAHHMVTADIDEIVQVVPLLEPHRAELAGRSMLCHRAHVFPAECVIRGYLAGSAWKEYRATGTLAGEALPPGLRESDRLEPPLFSPATKATTGHDENITIATFRELVGASVAPELERLTRLVYRLGSEIAARGHARAAGGDGGIIIADTKLEFGVDADGRLLLVDEVLTPDSSRFWAADTYQPGQAQSGFDKQPLRDYLDGERARGGWNGEAPAPVLPEDIVDATSARYLDSYRRITGNPLDTRDMA
ncbi:MAG: phosphoribosylaminoimidazolesuccinocarboxamide synthase [Gemmatimonadaceae bacterium]